MKIGLEYLQWPRFDGGYEWRDAVLLADASDRSKTATRRMDTPDRRFLMQRAVAAGTTLTHPLIDNPTLFKTFAALDPTEDAFSAFAAQHGGLGVDEFLTVRGVKTPTPLDEAIGEPLSRWRAEWARLRAVVDLLDAIQTRNASRLGQSVILTDHEARLHHDFGDQYQVFAHIATDGTIANPHALRPWLWQFALSAPTRTDRLARLASGWVQAAINDSIDATRFHGEAAVPARILFDAEQQKMTLHVVPQTLLAALWFQCARVLTEHPTFKQCEHCGKWFELSADARRKQSKYCDPRCKVAAYRRRKVEHAAQASRRRSGAAKPTMTVNRMKRKQGHGQTTRTR